jgi:hypothetical protein
MSEVLAALGKQLWRMHYLRKWYEWCCDYGCDSFSEEVAFRLSDWTIGGNAKAVAVRSSDSREGPLNDLETTALLNALRNSWDDGSLSV